MKYIQIIHRISNRIYTSIMRKINEHYVYDGSRKLKYLYIKPKSTNSGNLIVCFPAFADNGAKYNYVKTIDSFDSHKIFFLDDFSENGRGNYLVEEKTMQLVRSVLDNLIEKLQPQKIFFIGSSKGGFSALFYSFLFENVNVCIASPQYYIGNYLNCDSLKDNLIDIVGCISDEKIVMLNNLLSNQIKYSKIRPNSVWIHYSDSEHTYWEHIKYLIDDLRNNGIKVYEDVEHYSEHSQLVNYFPAFLRKTLKREL